MLEAFFDFFFSAPLLFSSLLGAHNCAKGIGFSTTHPQAPFQKSKKEEGEVTCSEMLLNKL